ncbi:MAG TPA: T9SS type A sorting domain-containing protein [Chryseosolibacter sp.]|nr:T9SS type A sorting domain-containing protein [Chryseosolibacter sp.]
MVKRVVVASVILGWFSAITLISIKSPVSETKEASLAVDGPDKAHLLNYWMIHDRAEGRIPYERLHHAKVDEISARRQTEADFIWTNWDTKLPGRGRVVFYHKPSQTLFTGSVTGGLWKNTNYANNGPWDTVDDFDGASVNCMAQDPNDQNTLYIGTGESFTAFVNYRESTALGSGIFKSTDAGNSWTKIPGTEKFYFVNDMVVRNESGASVIYVAAGSGSYRVRDFISEGLYRSADQGSTWTEVLPYVTGTSEQYAVADLELTSSNRLYAATQRNINEKGGGVIWYSDNGTTWSSYKGFANFTASMPGWFAGRAVVRHAPSNPAHVYALFTRGVYNSLLQLRDYVTELRQSKDAGVTWTVVPLPENWANIPWHALSLAVDPANENKIVIGGLDIFVLNNTQAEGITPLSWIRASDWFTMYYLYDPSIPEEEKEILAKQYVHGDIHDLNFFNGNPDDMLITTDGGVFLTNDMGATVSPDPEPPNQGLPAFRQLNNALNTTQYYYARIHPGKGVSKVVGGTQDNGCIYVDNDNGEETMISGGDGGYCFWDSDHPDIKISTVYGNGFFIHRGNETFSFGVVNGLFINPMDYDDQANLLYTNAATSSFGGLFPQLKTRYYDTLEIVNVNKFLLTDDHGLDTVSFIKLKAGLKEAITAIKLSKYSPGSDKTAIIGTESGKIFKLTGLPKSVKAVRIDNSKLPAGYISSVDIGADENTFLATISNFGLPSVWVTYNGGTTWRNLDNDLPDMPVRWGLFNPFDDKKVVIATEAGVWGLENTVLTDVNWKSYNHGLPSTRVDMIDIRKSDSTILAVTHGHGLWTGKLDQGPVVTDVFPEPVVTSVEDKAPARIFVYPNPATDIITVKGAPISRIVFRTLAGRKIETLRVEQSQADIRHIQKGVYIIELLDADNRFVRSQKLLKR